EGFRLVLRDDRRNEGTVRRRASGLAHHGRENTGTRTAIRSQNFSGRHPALLAVTPKRLWSMGFDDFRGNRQETLCSLTPRVNLVIVCAGRECRALPYELLHPGGQQGMREIPVS